MQKINSMLRKGKKALAAAALGVMCCSVALVCNAGMTVDSNVAFNKQYAELGGKAAGHQAERANIIITESGYSVSDTSKIVLYDEAPLENDGTFRFVFRLPDASDAPVKDYDAYVHIGNEPIQIVKFSYYGKIARSAVLESIKGADSPESLILILNDENNQKVLYQLGFDSLWYKSFKASENREWGSSFLNGEAVGNLTEENLANALHGEMSFCLLKSGTKIDEALNHTELGYDGLSEDAKKFTVGVFNADRPKTLREVTEIYEFADALYKISGGNISNADKIITDRHSALGISSSDYSSYERASESRRFDICEKILKKLSSEKVRARADFAKLFSDLAVSKTSGESKPSGGGGGGSSKVTYPTNTDNYVSRENKEKAYYNDIDDFMWANEAITVLTDKKIISGNGAGQFYPGNPVTREEFLKMIVLAVKIDMSGANAVTFGDVPPEAWYYPYVCAGVSNKITNGMSETVFGAGAYVTRQDAAVMLKRAFEKTKKAYIFKREYSVFNDDGDISDYAKKGTELLYRTGIVNGYDDNTFRPFNNCTRAEAAKIIYKAFFETEE